MKNVAGGERIHAVGGRYVHHAAFPAVRAALGRHMHGAPCAVPVAVCGGHTVCARLGACCAQRHEGTHKTKSRAQCQNKMDA